MMKENKMKRLLAAALCAALAACAQPGGAGASGSEGAREMIQSTRSVASRYSFDETVSRLETAFKAKGMTVFAVIDHQAAARQNGLAMQPAKVIVFGTPKAGTPLMVKDPQFALKLPLKVLVTETGGKVDVVFEDTRALIAGSRIEYAEVENSLAKAEKLIAHTVGG